MSFARSNVYNSGLEQLAHGGSALGVRNRNPEEEAMFGPPGRTDAVPQAFDYYMRDHKQSRDYRAQLGSIMSEVITGLVMRFPAALLQLLPFELTQKLSILIHRQEYTGGLFGEVPEEGISRVLVATESSEQKAMIRRGLAVRVESTALVLPEAQRDFRNAVESLAISASETMLAVSIRALLEAGNRSSGFTNFFWQNYDPIIVARREADLTGLMQANPKRLISMVKEMHGILTDNLSGAAPAFLDALVPGSIGKYLQTENRVRSELEGIDLRTELFGTKTAGTILAPAAVMAGNVRVWIIPPDRAARLGRGRVDQVIRNMMEAQQVYAEWTPAFWEGRNIYDGVTHLDIKDTYNSTLRNVTVFSCPADGLVEISFAKILYHGGAGRIPAPDQVKLLISGNPIARSDFTGVNNDGKRRVPYCWYNEPNISEGQPGWCGLARAWAQCDENVIDFAALKSVARSLLAEIAKANGGPERVAQLLGLARSQIDSLGATDPTKKDVDDLIAENTAAFATLESITAVDRVSAAQAGWPEIMQASANPNTGTLKPASERSPGFASFYGLRAMNVEGLASGTDTSDILQLFVSAERIALAANSGNFWLNPGGRHSWFPHSQEGAMAAAMFAGEAQIPAFVRTTGVSRAPGGAAGLVVGDNPVPYMEVGVNALDTTALVNVSALPSAIRAAVSAVEAQNLYLNYGPNYNSSFYGANKFVVLRDSIHGSTVIVPADFAYCYASFLSENLASKKLSDRTQALFAAQVKALVAGKAPQLAEDYASALAAASTTKAARGAVLYLDEHKDTDDVRAVIDALTNKGAAKTTAGKKPKTTDILQEILAKGDEDTAPASVTTAVRFADENVRTDFNNWLASSGSLADKSDNFPFASTGKGDSGCAELVYAALKQGTGGAGVQLPYMISKAGASSKEGKSIRGAGGVLYAYDPTTDLSKRFTAEIERMADKKKRSDLPAVGSATAVSTAAKSTNVGSGTWVRTPLVLSRRQALVLAKNDWDMRPGNPATGYTTVYTGKSPDADFSTGLAHISAAAGDSRTTTVHISMEVNDKAAASVSISGSKGAGAGKIGGHFGALAGQLNVVDAKPRAKDNPVYSVFSSTNFKRNVANVVRISQAPLQMAYLMACGMRIDDPRYFQQMDDANIMIPLAGIIFRPRLVLRVASLVLLAAGPDTGKNFIGDINAMFGTDTKIKVSELNVTLRHNTVIENPNNVLPGFNMLITGCVSGGGVTWANQFDTLNKDGDLYAAVIPIQEQALVPAELNIRGRFSFTSQEVPEANRLHFSMGPLLNQLLKLDERYMKRNVGRENEPYLARRRALPEIFLQAPYAVRSSATQSGWVFRFGRTLSARNQMFYEKAMGAGSGDGTYLRSAEEIARDIATIPIAPRLADDSYRQVIQGPRLGGVDVHAY